MVRLTEKQIADKIKFINDYKVAKNAATGSKLDANANVSCKNIATLSAEINKDINIQINRKLLDDKIKEMFGEDLAKEYIRQIEAHEIYTHDESSLLPYCASVSMYPFLLDGLKSLGGDSTAPKNINSFCGSYVNLIFALSSQFAGAVSTPEFLNIMDWFLRKDYGDDYLNTRTKDVEQWLQSIVYAVNQPASARNYQSVFLNWALFDKYYFESVFGNFVFPDGSQPKYESVAKLQEFFMTWFNKERTKALLTFPVITAAILSEGDEPKDKDFSEMLSKQLSEGNSFFIYNSAKADSLSSCCFPGFEKVLIKDSINGVRLITLKELNDEKNVKHPNLKVHNNGFWSTARPIKVLKENKKLFSIRTAKNQEFIATDDHIVVTDSGDKQVKDLSIDDYLLVNTMVIPKINERDENLTYEMGVLIGAYLGDGSIYKRLNNNSQELTLSLNQNKVNNLLDILNKSIKQLGLDKDFSIYESKNNVVFAKITSNLIIEFIEKWTTPAKANEKGINLNCLMQSESFRKGILFGLHKTDGHSDYNIIYTSSNLLSETLQCLIISLGGICNITIDDRTNEPIVIRGEKFKRNFPVNHIRFYFNRLKEVKNVLKVKNNQLFIKVIKKEEFNNYEDEYVYCLEMKDKNDHYFTLPNGIQLSNCRLRNELTDNSFSSTLGSAGVATGSINVITLNLNSLVQEGRDLKTEIEKIHKYQVAYKSIVEDFYNHDLLPVYKAGFISLKKQFLTIGLNGFVEAAEFLGYKISNNEEYKSWLSNTLKIIYDSNKEASKIYNCIFNSEFTPAESLGVKNATWDKKKGLKVNRDCYNSYMYRVEDNEISIVDKFILHGNEIIKYLDGGSALHLNLQEYPTQEAYYKLICLAIKTGCNYFTTNVKITICNTCENIDKRTLKECPKCGSHDLDYAVRIIGYLKRISSFSEARQVEASKRIYHPSTTQ